MFAKIFNQIYSSSIAENWQQRLVFMDMLVLADRAGIVDMTHEAISRRTNVPLEIIKNAIAELEKPDPKSRNPAARGARIMRMDSHRDWGWWIVNYDYYREIASEEQRREKTRERVANFRQQKATSNGSVTHGNACNAPVTLANAGNAMQRQRQMQMHKHQKERANALPPLAVVWNENCGQLPKALHCSDKRMVNLQKRSEDKFFVENFKAATIRAAASKFCNGKSERGWRATFDWMLQPDSVTKIMEGKYDDAECEAVTIQTQPTDDDYLKGF